MTADRRRVPGGLGGALGQTALGAVAHAAAAGCLPGTATLALAVPAAVVGVLLLARLLPDRPLQRLAGGQLVVHAALAASACAGAAHAPAGHAGPDLVMTGAHVAALVVCRAASAAVLHGAERAAGCVPAFLRPLPTAPALRLPALPGAPLVRSAVPRSRTDVHRRTPRRGPPARVLLPLPV